MVFPNELVRFMKSYFKGLRIVSVINGRSIVHYGASRGFFRMSQMSVDLMDVHFGGMDLQIWIRVLTMVRPGRDAHKSGGLYFRYDDFKDLCKRRSWYRARKKFFEHEFLLPTEFKDYYILNNKVVIKMYNPKEQEEETKKEE